MKLSYLDRFRMYYKTISLVLICAFSSFSLAMAESTRTEPQAIGLMNSSFGTTISGTVNDHIRLGTAYDSLQKRFLNLQCVDGVETEEFGNVEAVFETGIDLGFDEIVKMLNGNIDVDVNFSIVRAGAGAQLAKETASTNASQSFTLHAYIRPKNRTFKPVGENFTLSPLGNDIATNYQTQLYELAGDEFVTSIQYGAELFINMKLDYKSEADKMAVSGYLDVDFMGGLVSASGRLAYLDESIKKSIKITIKAFQKGGDPKQLLTIIPNNIATCTLNDSKPCFDMFSEAVQYARHNFEPQFDQLSDYNIVKYQTTRYDSSTADLKRLVPAYQSITWATKMLMIELEEDLKQALVDEKRAADILTNYYALLSDIQRAQVENIKTYAYDNAFIHAISAKYCHDHPFGTACQDYLNNIQSVCDQTDEGCIKPYDPSQLEIAAEDISKWFKCEDARQYAMINNMVTQSEADGYLKLGWAPIFFVVEQPELGIAQWGSCKVALETYGSQFD